MPDYPLPARTPHIDGSRCQACSMCLARKACRVKAIVNLDPGEQPLVDGSRCYGCLVCVPACPFEAVLA